MGFGSVLTPTLQEVNSQRLHEINTNDACMVKGISKYKRLVTAILTGSER